MSIPSDLPVHRGRVWRRATILIALCVTLALFASSDALHGALIELLAEIEAVIVTRPLLGVTLFVLFAAVSAMFTFVSVAAVVPVAVYTWGAPFSIVLLWTGWILGGIAAYAIGRYLGRPAIAWLTAGDRALGKLESRIGRNAPFGLILLFQLALPSELPGYVLGLTRYRFPLFLLSLGLAELPYAVATVVLGQSFLQRQSGVVLIAGAAVATLSIGTFYALRKAFARG